VVNADARPIRVLLVDDHDLVLRMMVAVLRMEEDVEVVGTATTIEDAIRVAEEVQPEVVVMDYRLPDGDGLTGTRRMHEILPAAKVVMLTGRDDPDTRALAFQAGCSGFVTKGARLDELLRVIRSLAGAGEVAQP
jgi:DNA-binding NarL/FixJ family response regulator